MNSDIHDTIDEPLLLLVAAGDEVAFSKLFEKYASDVYGFLMEHVDDTAIAEDLVQDIFTKIWLLKETLPEIKKFHGFLFVMARNHAFNHIKIRVRERSRIKRWSRDQESVIDAEQPEADFQMDLIEEAIKSLPQQQQKVWLMSRREKKKYSEIALEMNLSRQTVKKYIQYANEQLKKVIQFKVNYPAIIFLSIFLQRI